MLPRRRAPLALSVWLLGAASALAAGERGAWSTLGSGAPGLWAGLFAAAILAGALLGHLVVVLRKKRVDPPALVEALTRTIQSGNYQEAWELCQRWRQTALARILQPSLERIGQGTEAVTARLAEEEQRERRHLTFLRWSMTAGGGAVVLLSLLAVGAEIRGVAAAAMSPNGPRASTIAAGNIAMLLGLALAVAAPVMVAAFWLRARAARMLHLATERGMELVTALPYEDIEGVRIGRDFHAGTLLGDATALETGLQVSKELTTLCPTCNGPINSSRASCPHCGQLLTWS